MPLPGRGDVSRETLGMPGCRPVLIHSSLFTIHSQPGRKFAALSEFRPPPLLLRGEEEERPGVEEKKRLWCKLSQYRASTRWFCTMWQAYASLVQTRMPPASLSAAAPLVRTLPVTSSLFTLTSYFREAGGGAGWPRSGQTEGASARLRPAAHYFFPLHFYLLLLLGSPCGGAGTAQP